MCVVGGVFDAYYHGLLSVILNYLVDYDYDTTFIRFSLKDGQSVVPRKILGVGNFHEHVAKRQQELFPASVSGPGRVNVVHHEVGAIVRLRNISILHCNSI